MNLFLKLQKYLFSNNLENHLPLIWSENFNKNVAKIENKLHRE